MKHLTNTVVIVSLLLAGCGAGTGVDGGANNPPEISGRPAAMVRAGDTYSFTPEVNDSDGDQLSFSIENLPGWAFFDAGSGTISGFPDKTNYGDYRDIIIHVSDGSSSGSFSFSLDVLPALLGRDNFSSRGAMLPTADGFQSVGTLVMTVDGEEKQFEDSDLQLKFNAEGDLIEMLGETIIPKKISDTLALDAEVKTTVGYFSGRQLNADPDIDILLKDEQYYFVYYYGQDLDMTLTDPGSGGSSSLTISTPLGGEILLITDASDVFYYYYGNIPFVGAAGHGESFNGFIPFEPSLDYDQLDHFDGHIIDKAEMGIGLKIFDFFSVEGIRVIRQPDFAQILFDDPFFEDPANSLNKVEYKMGVNGDADFAFSIVGFELFRFDLTEVSATLDVGFDRQHMAMRSYTAPDFSWVPAEFLFVPESETIGDWYIDGNGSYEIKLSSTFTTDLPSATISGSMGFADGDITLAGMIDDGNGKPLSVEATFFPRGVDVVVGLHYDFDQGIQQTVTAAMDDKLAELQQAFDNLQQATAGFEFEMSLRGLRSAIPAIVNSTIPILDAVPGTVRTAVDNTLVNYVNNYRVCTDIIIVGEVCTNPLDPLINQNTVGNQLGEQARKITADAIVPYKNALNALKNAVNASDDVFRAAIKTALQAVYDRRVFSKAVKITYTFPLVGKRTVYSKTVTRALLIDPNLTTIKRALDNVDNIQATSNVMISAQQILDQLPLESAINAAKEEVEAGLAQIPASLDGVGYSVIDDAYSAYVILGGEQYSVQFNVLNPDELASGVGRLIADFTVE